MSRAPWILLAVTLAAAGCRSQADAAAEKQQGPRVVPVVVAAVERRDVPVWLEGLGSVIAFRTVTVKTQVDGRLDKVYFREGQAVRHGDSLAQIDPRPFEVQLHQAEGALARDRAILHDAQVNLERFIALRERKLVSQQQVDDQRAQAGQYEGAVRIDEAQAESAKLNLDYAHINSPIDGVTGVRLVDQGNVVHPGDASGIVVVTQLDPIAVLFTLPQDDLPSVMRELRARALPVEVYSRDGATRLGAGELALVDNQINQTTATMRLKAVLPNPERMLWPNQFVKARLLLTTRKGAVVVPATVVQRGPKGTFAYVVRPDQTVDARPVEMAATVGEEAIVARGLEVGETVVVDGQNQLKPGAKVQPRKPGQPGAGAAAGRK